MLDNNKIIIIIATTVICVLSILYYYFWVYKKPIIEVQIPTKVVFNSNDILFMSTNTFNSFLQSDNKGQWCSEKFINSGGLDNLQLTMPLYWVQRTIISYDESKLKVLFIGRSISNLVSSECEFIINDNTLMIDSIN